MFYWIANFLNSPAINLRLFHFLTFRSLLAALTAFALSLLLGPTLICWLQRMQIGQSVRDDGPKSHLTKSGTPTMGGALILATLSLSVLLWGDLYNHYLWLVLLVTLAFGVIGWVDDYKKLVLKNSKGLSAKSKYALQSLLGFGVAAYLYWCSPGHGDLQIPFVSNYALPLSWFYPLFVYFVIVGTSNAVNLTDGLDGLASLPVALVALGLSAFALVSGSVEHAHYFNVPHLSEVSELCIFCAALAGACFGFLWFNAYPAEVFMGDVGSLALGAALGLVAVCVRAELVLLIMGGLFVAETISVILQVGYFRLSGGKRIFRMAPLHHHFELKGWPETKVTVRFWIVTIVCVVFGLTTLLVR